MTTPGFPAQARFDLKGATRSVQILKGMVDGVIAARAAPGPTRRR